MFIGFDGRMLRNIALQVLKSSFVNANVASPSWGGGGLPTTGWGGGGGAGRMGGPVMSHLGGGGGGSFTVPGECSAGRALRLLGNWRRFFYASWSSFFAFYLFFFCVFTVRMCGRWSLRRRCLAAGQRGRFFWSLAHFAHFLRATVEVILEWDRTQSIILSAVVALLYTMMGGLYSVAYTDVVQLFAIFFGLVPFPSKSPQCKSDSKPENRLYPHPSCITTWEDNLKKWPEIRSPQIVYYLLKTKACDLEEVKAYKSLDSYNYVRSGWVGALLVHEIDPCTLLLKGTVQSSQSVNRPNDAWICAKKDGGSFHGNAATRHGQMYEPVARQAFIVKTGFTVSLCGTVVCSEEPWLSATPDGIIESQNAIPEIKCPEVQDCRAVIATNKRYDPVLFFFDVAAPRKDAQGRQTEHVP
ncbi:hypothetical protein HPB47_022741 [Ixodes persulcatus]|uniref:Uncharacterized protein n=1 Tax=Ixodes persulcatus TaxID=34615 RepID=A0AC60Q8W2_IXOPE|nr:hypothetical protein HPB47_022741 [Ixodes persulcatus]